MRNHTTHFSGCDCVTHKIEKLEAENAQLREALENIMRSNYGGYAEDIAREALKGGE
jgi:uncharacterized protein (UPF0335 family)